MQSDDNNKSLILDGVVGALLLTFVGVADYLSGSDISFSLFYLLVVALAAWRARDIELTLAAALVCAIVSLGVQWVTLGAPEPATLLWNAGTLLATLITIGMLISRLKQALDAEKVLARTDFLTGVLNGRAFSELAAAEILRARAVESPLAIAYLDLDNFKSVNDRLGHEQGDGVLREVARVLRNSVRKTDSVARVGGDEFLLCLPETSSQEAEAVMRKLQHALKGTMESYAWPVTFSIGVAVCACPPADLNQLVRAADAMMYKAKAEGKNCVRVASHSFSEAAARAATPPEGRETAPPGAETLSFAELPRRQAR